MREILFRGKRVDNGEWVFGDLLHNCDCVKIRENETEINHVARSFPVLPKTIGQYIGLTDKNGTRIFEGNIVQYKNTLHEVVFCRINGCAFFGITMPGRGEIWNFDGITCADRMEVIGNIHDNGHPF